MTTTTAMARPGNLRRLAAAAGAVVVVAIGVLMLAGSRDAPGLGAVSPADGAQLRDPPREVSLTFQGEVTVTQVHIGVSDDRGEPVPSGTPKAAGATITAPVTIQDDGDYGLAYHVVLSDGRVFSGISRFRLSATPPAGAAPAPAPPRPAAPGHEHLSDDPLSAGLLVVAAVFVVVLLAMLFHRPRPRG